GLDAALSPLSSAFRLMVDPWGNRVIGDAPREPSEASNDGTPFELSIAWGRSGPELRVMVEALGEEATLRSRQRAGRMLSRRLGTDVGVAMERLLAIEPLFYPDVPEGSFAAWHAAAWQPGWLEPRFKVYWNLQCGGRDRARSLLGAA